MNPLAAGAAFLAIFLIGGPVTGGDTAASIGIGVVAYLVVSAITAAPSREE